MKKRYLDWTRIPWDGNRALKLKCWRKSFGRGHVSVGIGTFKLICYDYGANSVNSISSTRDRSPHELSEKQAMAMVDRSGGKWRS